MDNSNMFFVLGIILLIASIVLYNVLQIRSIRRFFNTKFHKNEVNREKPNDAGSMTQTKNTVLHPTVLLDEDEE